MKYKTIQYKGRSCAAVNCTSLSSKGLSYFRFPRNKDRCQIWVRNCGREDLRNKSEIQLYSNFRLCAKHFEPSQFMNKDKKKLTWTALPTIFEVSNTLPTSLTIKRPPLQQSTELPVKRRKLTTALRNQQQEENVLNNPEESKVERNISGSFLITPTNVVKKEITEKTLSLMDCETQTDFEITTSSNYYQDYNFPSNENYFKIVTALKLKRLDSPYISKTLKLLLQRRFKLFVADGVETVLDKKTSKPIVLRSCVNDVLKKCHDEAKHPGSKITENNIKRLYAYVPQKVIVNYVKNCEHCISQKSYYRNVQEPLPDVTVNRTGVEKILVGTTFISDEKYIINITDPENKFTWAGLLGKNTAKDAANLVRNFFKKFGAPKMLETDNGSVFLENDFVSMMMEFPNTVQKVCNSWLESDKMKEKWHQFVNQRLDAVVKMNSSTLEKVPFQSMVSDPVETFESQFNLVSEIDIEYEPEVTIKEEPVSDTESVYEPFVKITVKDEPVSDAEVD